MYPHRAIVALDQPSMYPHRAIVALDQPVCILIEQLSP